MNQPNNIPERSITYYGRPLIWRSGQMPTNALTVTGATITPIASTDRTPANGFTVKTTSALASIVYSYPQPEDFSYASHALNITLNQVGYGNAIDAQLTSDGYDFTRHITAKFFDADDDQPFVGVALTIRVPITDYEQQGITGPPDRQRVGADLTSITAVRLTIRGPMEFVLWTNLGEPLGVAEM